MSVSNVLRGFLSGRLAQKCFTEILCELSVTWCNILQASSKDADQMYSAIDRRIQQLKMQECHKDDGGTSTQEPTSESQMASQGSEYAVPLHTGQKRHKEETTDDHPPVVKKRR